MSTPIRSRCSFTPEALAKFASLIDDVERELALETPEHHPSRSSLAKKAFALARYPWTYKQLRELLLRAFRNEKSQCQRATFSNQGTRILWTPLQSAIDTQEEKQPASWREAFVTIALLLIGAGAFVIIDKWVAPTFQISSPASGPSVTDSTN